VAGWVRAIFMMILLHGCGALSGRSETQPV
jgi:hypothetical protein